MSLFRCKICLKIILFNGDKLNKHLNSVHKTSVTWYKQTHLTDKPVTDQLAMAVRSAAVFGDHLTPPPLLPRAKSHNASPKKKQIYRLPQQPQPQHHHPQQHHPPPQLAAAAVGGSEGGDGKQYFSDNTEEMCVALCQICGAALKYFRSHVKDVHKMTMSDYRISCGNTTYQKETYHRQVNAPPLTHTHTHTHTHEHFSPLPQHLLQRHVLCTDKFSSPTVPYRHRYTLNFQKIVI